MLDAIRRCFGSLWSERAIDYRARQGLPPMAARLAVVVRQMVFAIPAVMGTGNATRKIRNGQIVTVYGSVGKVRLV